MEANGVTSIRTTKVHTSVTSETSPHPISQSRTVFISRSLPGANVSGMSTIRAEKSRRSFMAPSSNKTLVNSGVSKFMQGRGKEKKDMQELNQRFGNYIEKTRFLEAQNRKLVDELATLRDRWGKETERIRMMYETEMKQLRKLLDESEQSKGELQVRISSLEDRELELQSIIDDLKAQDVVNRETIDKLHQTIGELESEITVLRRRVSKFDEERARDKREMERLRQEIQRLRTDLDSETLAHINAENEAQSCKDELEFIKQVHDAQLQELSNLAYRDTTAENRDFWRAELAQALQEIQNEYDNKIEDMKGELDSTYAMKMQEFRTNNTRGTMESTHLKEENKRLKSLMQDLRDRIPMLEAKIASLEAQIQDLTRDLEDEKREHDLDNERLSNELDQTKAAFQEVVDEVQELLDAKLSLELEIVAYRKLLDGEETRFSTNSSSARMSEVLPTKAPKPKKDKSDKMGAEPVVEGAITAKTNSGQMSAPPSGGVSVSGSAVFTTRTTQRQSISRGEASARTIFQRTTKGDVAIKECSIDGTHIVLENTGIKKQEIGGWTLKRNIDSGNQMISFTLPSNTTLETLGSKKLLTIWAKGRRPKDSKDMECNDKSWGIATRTAATSLLNEKGEERATNTAKTTYGDEHDH